MIALMYALEGVIASMTVMGLVLGGRDFGSDLLPARLSQLTGTEWLDGAVKPSAVAILAAAITAAPW